MSPVRETLTESLRRANASYSSLSKLRPDAQRDPLQSLEQTFTAYTIALRSREGNIIGRALLNRVHANATEVDELCNALIEDASRLQAAAEVTVDVLFASFEAFMNRYWKASFGPVISGTAMRDLLTKVDSMPPRQFEEDFRYFLRQLLPLNRRALTAVVDLLADLLDATGNDGDRGVLTATFAELIAEDCPPQSCIPLLDRFIQDFDELFGSANSVTPLEVEEACDAPSLSTHRSLGSVSSDSAAVRRRFGFGHSKTSLSQFDGDDREAKEAKGSDKKESEDAKKGKVSHILRSLSKGKGLKEDERALHSKGSLSSKSSLFRSKSQNTIVPDESPIMIPRRPSKDRTPIQSVFPQLQLDSDNNTPPSSSGDQPLESIGEEGLPPPLSMGKSKPKKKRRSSLSDLPPNASQRPAGTAHPVHRHEPRVTTPLSSARSRSSLAISHHDTTQSRYQDDHISAGRYSPVSTRMQRPLSLRDSHAGLRSHGSAKGRSNLGQVNHPLVSTKSLGRSSAIPPLSPRKGADVRTSRSALSHRSTPDRLTRAAADGTQRPASPTKPLRTRMHNPQTLRGRLQADQTLLETAETNLLNEIKSLQEAMTAQSSSESPSRSGSETPNSSLASSQLFSRVCSLEARLSAMMTDFKTRADLLEKDIQASLLVSERRAQELDALYREATAQNAVLHEKYIQELDRLADSAMGHDSGEEALRLQLHATLVELERSRKENLRLKRENSALRSQQGHSPDRGLSVVGS
ncbi:hypothetical protein KEM52_001322 [Ascosphaera acerosa]|nr:hypothetical protein KEM52_001322 [Ascosphaera acerosa]